ncbi:MAG TPA: DUF4349 domain-containing protein [Microbacteriaceae bacterium]|nr:DUF4349 domain-containing protein [Microbacteriaceae bacterium]
MNRTLGGAVVVLAALLLVGCTASGPNSSGSAVSTGAPGSAPDTAPGKASGANNLALPSDRKVVTTGTVSLTVADPLAAASSATQTVTAAGGRVDSRTEQPATDTTHASATLVLRIPSAKLDATLTTLQRLGRVDNVTLNASDVTTQVKDIDARITALQTSVDRLLGLLSKATTVADMITIESALSERQAELDSLKSQQTYLNDQVSMSTITLELHSEGVVPAGSPDSFWGGIIAGWNALVVAANGFLIVLGVALPWLVVFGLLGGLAWWIVWRSGRKRRAAA